MGQFTTPPPGAPLGVQPWQGRRFRGWTRSSSGFCPSQTGEGRPRSRGDQAGCGFCPDEGLREGVTRDTRCWQPLLTSAPSMPPSLWDTWTPTLAPAFRRGLLGLRPEAGCQRPAWSWGRVSHSSVLFRPEPWAAVGASQLALWGHVGPGTPRRCLCECSSDSGTASSSEEVSELAAGSAWTSESSGLRGSAVTESRGCCPPAREGPR